MCVEHVQWGAYGGKKDEQQCNLLLNKGYVKMEEGVRILIRPSICLREKICKCYVIKCMNFSMFKSKQIINDQ